MCREAAGQASGNADGSPFCLQDLPRATPFSLEARESIQGEKDHTEAQAGMQQNFNELKEEKRSSEWGPRCTEHQG